jgi:S1-C subfamily serine protease
MDMNDTWPPTTGSADETPGQPAATQGGAGTGAGASPTSPGYPYGPAPAQADPQHGTAIPLPATTPLDVEQQPTSPNPPVGVGSPTPPAGTQPQPPQPPWGVGTPAGAPPTGGWGGGTPGGTPPFGGWQPPGFMGPDRGPTPSKGRKGLAMTMATVAVAVAVLAGVGLGHAVWPVQSASSPTTAPRSLAPGGSGSSGSSVSPFGPSSSGNSSTGAGAPSNISSIASKVDPGLVDINTNLSYQNEQAAGTGMVITSSGEVLTNNHVIEGATSISVTDVGNGKTYTGSVVGYDRTGDIAVIKLAGASGLQTVSTSSATAAVGQAVVGVGNAGGTGGTPSAAGGSVTAVNQSITASDSSGGNAESLTGLIEINADIQPGDSGGALVNTSGQVIGMDTAASAGSGYQVSGSQAYAIPISTALSIAKQIEAGKASSTVHIGATGFLGVSVQSSSGSAGGFGSGANTTSGAVVGTVLSGSPAEQAGLAPGDVITALNGASVGSATDLSNLLQSDHPGDTVQLQWTDGSGQTHTATVKLTSGPPA